jgi:hypothetical protein
MLAELFGAHESSRKPQSKLLERVFSSLIKDFNLKIDYTLLPDDNFEPRDAYFAMKHKP